MDEAPAMMRNSRHHWVPSSISSTAAAFSPWVTSTSTMRNTGNNAVAGIDAAIWTTGCNTLARRALVPMSTPAGSVQVRAMTMAAMTRNNVAPVPTPMPRQLSGGTRSNRPLPIHSQRPRTRAAAPPAGGRSTTRGPPHPCSRQRGESGGSARGPRPRRPAPAPCPASADRRRAARDPQQIQKPRLRLPTVNISAAMRKNQPPAQLMMLFHSRLTPAKGRSSVRKRSHPPMR